MAINIYNIKKWHKMLTGKSVLHVNQDLGKYFEAKELKGYYNNMMEKVSYVPHLVDSEELPVLHTESGGTFVFPVAVFQFAFGLLDYYYESKEEKYLAKFRQCADWAISMQHADGAWNNFSYIYPEHPYGSMAQGEGASLLVRAYKLFDDKKYLEAAEKAINFMLKPLNKGGCTLFDGNHVVLQEYQHLPVVLNGWIFSWWGLYDYVLVTQDSEVKKIMDKSLQTLVDFLPRFSCSSWSMYDLGGKITSPFYHNLHIAQMEAMYRLTGCEVFCQYANKWRKQQGSKLYKTIAFVRKCVQKIIER